jgi:GAF domain-containing protein
VTGARLLGASIVALFGLGVAMAVRTYFFVRRAHRVRAKVVARIDATIDSHDPISQSEQVDRLVVELPSTARTKRTVALADAFGGYMAESLVGHDGTVPVLYDPARPDVVRIDKLWALYFMPACLCAPAVASALLIAYVWLAS